MKKTGFLTKLKKEGKLDVVEPSEEVSASYLKKSESHLESAKILLESNKLEESISMSYYGMYHLLLALLFKCGIKCENHNASILILKKVFGEEGLAEEIRFGKRERIDKQYYVDFELTKMDCEDMIKKAEHFTVELKSIIKLLNEEKISRLRQKLNEMLKMPSPTKRGTKN